MGTIPEWIDGLGNASQFVRRSPGFEPRDQLGFGPEHYELWNRVGPRTTVRELIATHPGSQTPAVALLRQLLLWDAVLLQRLGAHDPNDFAIDDLTDIDPATPEEARLLAEDVELATWEKRRIVAVMRCLRLGDYFELLGINPHATQREIKRAYHQLSKEFHPDRYYGKQLGSYAGLLTLIFETATYAVRTLSDPRTTTRRWDRSPTLGNRRRKHERYPHEVLVLVSSGQWPGAIDGRTEEIGEGGMFVRTRAQAPLSTHVTVEIALPEPSPLCLRGVVVSRTARGIGIELAPMSDGESRLYSTLLDQARGAAPQPDALRRDELPRRRPRLARGTSPPRANDPVIVGIDLGTTYTSVSATCGERVKVLPWANGSRSIPSVVHFPEPGRYVVGPAARARLVSDPEHTIASSKRLLSCGTDEQEVARHLERAAFDSTVGPDDSVVVNMFGESHEVVAICSYLLRAARQTAEAQLGHRVDQAVLTVPVSFSEERIRLVKRAGELAQLEVVAVIDEPTAAAFANRFDPEFTGVIGIYDFGGGTCDFSVVDVSGGDFSVLATAGDSWLGGDDLDLSIAEAVAHKFSKEYRVELQSQPATWQTLLFGAERAKRQLSTDNESHIFVPDAYKTPGRSQALNVRITRSTVERLWDPVIDRSIATCAQALGLIGMRPADLSAIYLSGGSTYIPAVQRKLGERLGLPVRTSVMPDCAVCIGAGLLAAARTARQQRAAR